MKRLWFVIAVLAVGLLCASPGWAKQISVVLKTSKILMGEFIGATDTSVYLNTKEGGQEIARSKIKVIFDSETNARLTVDDLIAMSEQPAETEPAPAFMPPAAAPAPAPVMATAAPGVARVSFKDRLVSMNLGFSSVYGPENEQIKQLWDQLAPAEAPYHGSQLIFSLDLDLLFNIIPEIAIGPFMGLTFFSPGSTTTLMYYGGGYWFYSGGVYYWIPVDDVEITYSLDFWNIEYGAKVRGYLIKEEVGSVFVDVQFGQLELAAAAYQMIVDGVMRQNMVFHGTAPFLRLMAGAEAQDGNLFYGVSFGYQFAKVNEFTGEILQNDYYPAEEGMSGTVRDLRDGSAIAVDYSGPVVNFYMMINF